MAGGHLEFELRTGKAGEAAARRQQGDGPARILILADLRAQADRPVTLSERKPVVIDVDNAERVLARLEGRLSLMFEMPGAQPVELAFSRIEDFHPDTLFRHAEAFVDLRKLREELASPDSFARAAAALGIGLEPGVRATDTPPRADSDESDARTIERLLGRAPAAPTVTGRDVVERLVRAAVDAQVAPADIPAQAHALAFERLDGLIAERMRRILRHPAFQRLEATWRAVWKLATELDTDDGLRLSLLDLSRDELRAALADPEQSGLARMLALDSVDPEAGPWSLLVGDFTFGPGAEDMDMLTRLGALAARAGAPFVAGASLALLGCADARELAAQSRWPEPDVQSLANWQALRREPGAAWLGLALPRVLARLPYGAKTDRIEAFAFEEMADGRHHEAYLWGNPAYALAYLAGQCLAEEGPAGDVAARLDIEGLPSHVYRDADGDTVQQPCAEVWLNEAAAEAILDRGLMPILSYRNRDAARLLRWQSLALPPRGLAGLSKAD